MVTFKTKLKKVGRGSYYVVIPKDFIKHKLIDADKELEFEVRNGKSS